MPPERQRAAGRLLLAAFALAVAVAGWALADHGDAAPAGLPAGAPPPSRAGDERSQPAAAVATVATDAAEERTAAVRGSIHGRVLDAAGAPLAGFRVVLVGQPGGTRKVLEPAADPQNLATAVVDGDGSFDFAELGKGDYQVQLAVAPHVVRAVRLAAGEQQQVELRLDRVAVLGTLHRGGVVSDRHCVRVVDAAGAEWLAGPGGPPYLATGADGGRRVGADASDSASDAAERGVIRLALAAGRYRLQVLQPGFGTLLGGPQTSLGEHELVVPSGVATTRFSLPIGGAELVVRVRLPNGERAPAFGVDVNRAEPGQRGYLAASSPDGGPVQIDDVPPGRWRVHVHAPQIAPLPDQEFEATVVAARVELEFAARPAATVFLCLRSGTRDLSLPPELLPPLVAGQDELRCELRNRQVERSNAHQLVWHSVPVGPASVLWTDRVVAGEHVFLPFEPLPASHLVVAPGVRNEVRLDVLPRACIDLCACDRGGREDVQASVAVFAGAVPVRRTKGGAPQRWRGWLPVGDYRVVVTRGDDVREQPLRVDRVDQTLRLRP